MRLAVTADLHWGHGERGNRATLALVDFLRRQPPDVLLLGGDQGTGQHFDECLRLFADLPSVKALVPGNHDLWVNEDDERGDSLSLFEQHLPALSAAHGYHFLDSAPLLLPECSLAIAGTINWYDYSWSLEKLKQETPDWEQRLRHMHFTRGRHNDRRFIRWPLDDVRFTRRVVESFERNLTQALERAERVLVLTHHPALYGLNFPREAGGLLSLDALLWDAFSGNQALEEVLSQSAERIAAIFSGHTHRARDNHLGPVPAYNIGGDYHFKRLLLFDWPSGKVEAHTFEP